MYFYDLLSEMLSIEDRMKTKTLLSVLALLLPISKFSTFASEDLSFSSTRNISIQHVEKHHADMGHREISLKIIFLSDYEIDPESSFEMNGQVSPVDGRTKISSSIKNFKEKFPGVFFPANSSIDSKELESLLKNPKVSFVVLDDRSEYKFGGDEKIQKNIDFMQSWYKKAKATIGENNIHKLVWLPKQKVADDLMNRMSFVPEAWLLKMDNFYSSHRSLIE